MEGLSQAMGATDPKMVEQVAMMLAQGVTIEELVAQGVPKEVIEAAMLMLNKQQAEAKQQSMGTIQDGVGLAEQQGLIMN